VHTALRVWPPVALVAMVVLGLAVRGGSTRVDDWFHRHGHREAHFFLFFTDPRVLVLVVLATMAVANYRHQWRLWLASALCPLIAMSLARLLKPVFGRQKEQVFAYPSGHITTVVVVMGMVVLAAGVTWWVVLIAVAWSVLALLGMAVTVHYFTDTVGAALLGSAIVCVAALVLGRAPHQT
jgi:membrane-associated phospholipid phosphatase